MTQTELVVENQLQVIVKDSGLEPTKAKFILDNFQNYFEVADEWTKKAKSILVTNENQTADMEMARVGRLFLREKRIAIEKARKELKEQALREGKAIDGIANVLKALIVPIEEYLEQQEKFVEIKKEKEAEARRLEVEKRLIEEERITAEKAAAEQERIRVENERLKKEAEEKDRQMLAERAKAEAELRSLEEKACLEREKADAERKAIEEKARKDREAQEKKMAEERAKVEAERKKAEEKARVEREKERVKLETERRENERLAELLRNQVECPKCGHKFQLKRS